MISNIVDASGNICKNWEANSNGTVLGTFKCPLPFEPSNFKYCCGKADLEHCCEFKNRYVKVKILSLCASFVTLDAEIISGKFHTLLVFE